VTSIGARKSEDANDSAQMPHSNSGDEVFVG